MTDPIRDVQSADPAPVAARPHSNSDRRAARGSAARLAARAAKTTTAWITRRKYRAVASVAAIAIAAMISIALFAMPWAPVVGVAVAAAAVSVSKLTSRLVEPTCLACGHDLTSEPAGVHGIACPSCGSVNSPSFVHLARLDAWRAAHPSPRTDSPAADPRDRDASA
jgi:hypothetical protein